MITRRRTLFGLLLLSTAGLSEVYVPRRSAPTLTDAKFAALFPKRFGPWSFLSASGLILPPEDQLSKRLYEQLLARVYQNDRGDDVMLVLAYSSVQEGRLQVHRPEVCYPAAGFALLSEASVDLRLLNGSVVPAKFLVFDRGARRECVLYWTRVGETLPRRWAEQRAAMARANLAGDIPDGMLARASVVSSEPGPALALLTQFVQTLVADAPMAGQELLVGRQRSQKGSV